MSADASYHVLPDLSDDVAQLIMDRCGLSAAAMGQVFETMRRMRLSFIESAVRSGLVDPEALKQAIAILGESAALDYPGIVERALQRQAQGLRPPVSLNTARATSRLLIAHAPDHPRSERLRALRTELLLLNDPTQRANMMVLLSAASGEGRSQLAAELAIAFSQLGEPTLLVDADLRKPTQHTLFETDNSQGLSSALAHGGPPQLAGVENFPHLCVLSSGPVVPNPLELLSKSNLDELTAFWQRNYRFVVIDTPPIADYADGLMMASCTQRVLVLSRAGSSGHRTVKDMLRRLANTQARVLGAVINHF